MAYCARTIRFTVALVDADLQFVSSGVQNRAPNNNSYQAQRGPSLSLPANNPSGGDSPIAGTVLPLKRAEELLATLPGVVSARIVAGASGAVDEIHLLTTTEVQAKQTVRNVESALLAHLGMRVNHKKISVATTNEPSMRRSDEFRSVATPQSMPAVAAVSAVSSEVRRRLYYEDVEVRRSRSKGVACRVTLKKGDEVFVGEAEGVENERQRIELAGRATLSAISSAEGAVRTLALEGCRQIEAFDKQFVFCAVAAKMGRDTALLTGSAEVKDSPEQSAVLAILDATNRWVEYTK